MNQKGKITASLNCSRFSDLQNVIQMCRTAGADYLHVDLMDGIFVSNYGLSVDYVKEIRALSHMPLDFHFMVVEPQQKVQWVQPQAGDIVTVHYESSPGLLDYFRNQKGDWKKFIALNPETPISVLDGFYDYIDGVTILMVTPGFIGQKLVPGSLEKVRDLAEKLKQIGREDIAIEVDGNVTYEHAKILKGYGADHFVCGSSSIFDGHLEHLEDNIRRFRRVISAEDC